MLKEIVICEPQRLTRTHNFQDVSLIIIIVCTTLANVNADKHHSTDNTQTLQQGQHSCIMSCRLKKHPEEKVALHVSDVDIASQINHMLRCKC